MQIVVSGNAINQAVISEENHQLIIQRPQTNIVELITPGPQGPTSFDFADLGEIQNVDATDRADRSVLYYDGNSDMYKVDSLVTIPKLSDGGNF